MGNNQVRTRCEGLLLRQVGAFALLCLLLAAGCGGGRDNVPVQEATEREPVSTSPAVTPSPPTTAATAAAPEPTPAMEEAKPSPDSRTSAPVSEPPPPATPQAQGTPAPETPQVAGETDAAPADVEAIESPPEAPAPPAGTAPRQVEQKAAAAPLDLDSLEQRLRETRAIGVFTKLALKNQVDDLLDKFRAFYQGRSNASLSQLRQPYEMLIMKALAILQDKDPPLANDLLQSREAIWKVLADREKFQSI